ncbi:MAG: ABC-F family ATP-binding cassette domain-containing protein [Acidimicrobiia bacterium]|nr:ABC-F family ATP-binding cassette domain-containing protein [Acidimicrobiia bacterium]
MLTARSVSVSLGGSVVLDCISLSVAAGQRLGIVGPNGIGKSTLLRVLAGDEPADDGSVERAPASTRVGLLPQEPDARPGESLRGYLARRTGITAASDALDQLTERLATDPGAVGEYSDALDAFLALGGDDFDARIGQVCAQVGLPDDRLDVEMVALSGGQFARAALAAILLSRFDVLLLDEPTNNLDFAGLAQLEHFIAVTPAAIVVVSHDRAFLDATIDRILEIEESSHRGREFAGNWSDFVAARDLVRRQGYERHSVYVAQRDALTARAQTQRSWSEQGKARVKRSGEPDKNIRAFKTARSEKQAAKARTTEREIERLEVVEKPWEGWELDLDLAPTERSGDVVVRLEHATLERGTFRLGPLDLEIGWGERVSILGPNGCGKSTLVHALLGELPVASGHRWIGPGVTVGSLDQARARFGGDAPLLGEFIAATELDLSGARSLLAKFGLGADTVGRPGRSLSAGERTRAQLAALMASGVNCLVLDEPTNHLDLPAIEQIEQALAQYSGTLLLVSHDRRFLDAVTVDRVIDLGP